MLVAPETPPPFLLVIVIVQLPTVPLPRKLLIADRSKKACPALFPYNIFTRGR